MFGGSRLAIIAGPCVIESIESSLRHAERLAQIARGVGLALVFKSSFDKANRTSHCSFRGPGLEAGIRVLERVKRETGCRFLLMCMSPSRHSCRRGRRHTSDSGVCFRARLTW